MSEKENKKTMTSGIRLKRSQGPILLVDDDHFLCEMVSRRLQKEGFPVETAPDSYKAITLLSRITPSLILLDIMLPSMSGLELLNVIRFQHFNDRVPIIMISGISNSNFIHQAMRMGGNDYFPKPLDMDKLVRRIGDLTGAKVAT